jgi:hypothetical protein
VLLDPQEGADPDREARLLVLLTMQIFDVMICRVRRSTQESQRFVIRHVKKMFHTDGTYRSVAISLWISESEIFLAFAPPDDAACSADIVRLSTVVFVT